MMLSGEREFRGPALLNCEGDPSCGEWVPHEYVETREFDLPKPTSKEEARGLGEFYRCRKCGTERVWGTIGEAFMRKKRSKDEVQVEEAQEAVA